MLTKYLKIYLYFILYFSIVGLSVVFFDFGYITSLSLYFFAPSLYLSLKNTKSVRKVFFYSSVFGVSTTLIFDYIAHVSNVWFVPAETGLRVLGAFPLEEILWAVLYFYIMIMSYETFFAEKRRYKIPAKKAKYFIVTALAVMLLFLLVLFLNKTLLVIPYFYGYLISFMIALPVITIFFKPHYVKRLIPVFLLFLIPFFIYEYTALVTDQWFFYGQDYIGLVNFFGKIIPLEEFLFLIFSTPGTICLYRLLGDAD